MALSEGPMAPKAVDAVEAPQPEPPLSRGWPATTIWTLPTGVGR